MRDPVEYRGSRWANIGRNDFDAIGERLLADLDAFLVRRSLQGWQQIKEGTTASEPMPKLSFVLQPPGKTRYPLSAFTVAPVRS